jgi:hypothetical protein
LRIVNGRARLQWQTQGGRAADSGATSKGRFFELPGQPNRPGKLTFKTLHPSNVRRSAAVIATDFV